MSATNDVSQSEDSANSLIDRSRAAASTIDGHSRAVVGVSRGRLVLLDPAWDAPRLECMSAEDLASRASRFEILVVRPGVRDADALPKDFTDPA